MADETKTVNKGNFICKTHLYAGRKKEAFMENRICVLRVEKQVDVNLSRSKISLLWGKEFFASAYKSFKLPGYTSVNST